MDTNESLAQTPTPELHIDPEFRSLCPPLTSNELMQLEANLVAERGCRDPLVVWSGTLLDGHNRHEICTRRALPFKTVEANGVASRADALEWIVTNQLGRRNLTPEQASYLRGRRYNLEKGRWGRESGKTFRSNMADKLAKEFNVTDRTIRSDGTYAAAIDTLAANVGPAFREKVLSRDSHVARASVVKLASLPPKEQAERARDIAAVSPKKNRSPKRRPQPKPPKGFLAPASSSAPSPSTPPPTTGLALPSPASLVTLSPMAASAPLGQAFKTFDEIPSGKYRCLYMNPPWEASYGDVASAETARASVSNEELASLDLARICHPNGAHLWLWTTWWLLRNSFVSDLLRKWGFNWNCEVVWVKDAPAGRCDPLRSMTDLLILATSPRGNLGVRDEETHALLTGPADATGKPAGTRDLITRCTSGPRIELFALSPVANWESFTPAAPPEGAARKPILEAVIPAELKVD